MIHVEGIGKRYRLGATLRHDTLRDAITYGAKGLFSKRDDTPVSDAPKEFWALRDVSFDVAEGEVVGIIGKNGAGKSTLLKILSRITPPTEGRIRLQGRVASLLEVGTGFHPELSGRENIYMNGAILGMTRREIKSKFDAIVAFAEIEKFLDTPVKRYSSGMYVRLAFAVAAHLEPEILIVDEVLAVGDAAFQKKCLGKMGEVAQRGRTVLFVSHNMGAVRNLCRRAVWLREGRVREAGGAVSVVNDYLRADLGADSRNDVRTAIAALPEDPAFRLEGLHLLQSGKPAGIFLNAEPIEVVIEYQVLTPTADLRVYFDILDEDRNILVRTFNDDDADERGIFPQGRYVSVATIPADLLAGKEYELRVYGTVFNLRACTGEGIGIRFRIESSNGLNRAYPHEPVRSKLQPRVRWETRPAEPMGAVPGPLVAKKRSEGPC